MLCYVVNTDVELETYMYVAATSWKAATLRYCKTWVVAAGDHEMMEKMTRIYVAECSKAILSRTVQRHY